MKYLITDQSGKQTEVISDTSLAHMQSMYAPSMDIQPIPDEVEQSEPVVKNLPKKLKAK